MRPRNIAIAVAAACVIVAFLVFLAPQVRGDGSLRNSILGANGLLLLWFAVLLVLKRKRGSSWEFDLFLRPQILVQGCVQASVYIYVSQFSHWISDYAPLIVYQLIFAVAFELLLSLHRYGNARIGYSVLPIVLSINLFIWIKPQYFYAQLLMVAFAVWSKHYIARTVNGTTSHVFNPSGIAMAVASLVLLCLGPNKYSLLNAIIDSYHQSRPHIFVFVLAVGSISQWAGRVSLVSLGTLLMLFTASRTCEWLTGMPAMNRWVDPSILVGVTLLITDPATCPQKSFGKLLFGACYALGILTSYTTLSYLHLPGYYAKIPFVPILNVVAPYFDRLAISIRWETMLSTLRGRMAQTVVYAAIFLILLPTIPDQKHISFLGSVGGAKWARSRIR